MCMDSSNNKLQMLQPLFAALAACCCRARVSARAVQKWRDTIAAVTPGVQQFQTSLLHPTAFSPWR
jgi:hypothetical protein